MWLRYILKHEYTPCFHYISDRSNVPPPEDTNLGNISVVPELVFTELDYIFQIQKIPNLNFICNFTVQTYFYTVSWYVIVILQLTYISIQYPWYAIDLYSPHIFLYSFLVRHRTLQSTYISIQFLGTSSTFTVPIYFYTVSWYVIDLYSPHIFLYSFLVRHRTLQSTYISIQYPWYVIDLYSPHIFLYRFWVRHQSLQSTYISIQYSWYVIVILQSIYIFIHILGTSL